MNTLNEYQGLLQSYWDALDALDEIFDAMVEAHENDEQPALVRDEAAWIVIPPAVVTGKEFAAAYAALIRANETVYDCLAEYGTKSPSEQIASIWDAKAALDEADSALSRCGARLLRLCGPDGEEEE